MFIKDWKYPERCFTLQGVLFKVLLYCLSWSKVEKWSNSTVTLSDWFNKRCCFFYLDVNFFFIVNSRNTAGIYAAALLARMSHAAESDLSLKIKKHMGPCPILSSAPPYGYFYN